LTPEFVSPENHCGPSPRLRLVLMSVVADGIIVMWYFLTERSLAVAQQAETSYISPSEYSSGVATDTNFIDIIMIEK